MKGVYSQQPISTDTTIRKWGNGLGLHIPKRVTLRLGLTAGDNIVFDIDQENKITLSVQPQEDKLVIEDLTMDDLFSPHDQQIAPEDPWGVSTGLESI